MTVGGLEQGLTLKELILRLDAKIDTFITAHENRHTSETQMATQWASDPEASVAGRTILGRIDLVNSNVSRIVKLEERMGEIEDRETHREILEKERGEVAASARSRFQWKIGIVAALIGSIVAALAGAVLRVVLHV